MGATIQTDQIDRIIQNHHHDPFEVLGPHQIEHDGKLTWVIRTYQPKASAVSVIMPETQVQMEMQTVHHPNFFECILDQTDLPLYQFKIRQDGHEVITYDPYAFPTPVLTDYDLHLFAEGNHHRIYEKMGAHVTEIDGVSGVYFAIWAPNARNVSVLGDFNHWDGRQHQMRKGKTGIWDLFVPDLKYGDSYKYEVKNYDGHIYEKSDPYGFQQEVRPKTASIVTNLESYEWADADWIKQRQSRDPLLQPVSVYEVHLGSWLHADAREPSRLPDGTRESIVEVSEYKPGARFLTYRELAAKLIPYVHRAGLHPY